MTKHGDQVRALAESPVVGARFKDFIARWEMNIEPPPVEKIEKYVLLYALNSDRILMSPRRPATPQRWGHTRLVDTAEEDYFNADDDDEEPIAIVSTPPPRGMLTGKRKRLLTVELRAVSGAGAASATDAARKTFTNERRDDESGKALLAARELTEKSRPEGVGDEAYTVYSVDRREGQGEAVTNARAGNVLITIRYSGNDDGDPLAAKHAMNGAQQAAEAMITALT